MNTRERIVKGGRSTYRVIEVFLGTPEDDKRLMSQVLEILRKAPTQKEKKEWRQ